MALAGAALQHTIIAIEDKYILQHLNLDGLVIHRALLPLLAANYFLRAVAPTINADNPTMHIHRPHIWILFQR